MTVLYGLMVGLMVRGVASTKVTCRANSQEKRTVQCSGSQPNWSAHTEAADPKGQTQVDHRV